MMNCTLVCGGARHGASAHITQTYTSRKVKDMESTLKEAMLLMLENKLVRKSPSRSKRSAHKLIPTRYGRHASADMECKGGSVASLHGNTSTPTEKLQKGKKQPHCMKR